MRLELVWREDELLLRFLFARIGFIRVERVDHQRTIHFYRFGVTVSVEEDAPTKSAHGGRTFLVQHSIGPKADDPLGHFVAWFLVLPGHFHIQV